jgi:hypothetical protein
MLNRGITVVEILVLIAIIALVVILMAFPSASNNDKPMIWKEKVEKEYNPEVTSEDVFTNESGQSFVTVEVDKYPDWIRQHKDKVIMSVVAVSLPYHYTRGTTTHYQIIYKEK